MLVFSVFLDKTPGKCHGARKFDKALSRGLGFFEYGPFLNEDGSRAQKVPPLFKIIRFFW